MVNDGNGIFCRWELLVAMEHIYHKLKPLESSENVALQSWI